MFSLRDLGQRGVDLRYAALFSAGTQVRQGGRETARQRNTTYTHTQTRTHTHTRTCTCAIRRNSLLLGSQRNCRFRCRSLHLHLAEARNARGNCGVNCAAHNHFGLDVLVFRLCFATSRPRFQQPPSDSPPGPSPQRNARVTARRRPRSSPLVPDLTRPFVRCRLSCCTGRAWFHLRGARPLAHLTNRAERWEAKPRTGRDASKVGGPAVRTGSSIAYSCSP